MLAAESKVVSAPSNLLSSDPVCSWKEIVGPVEPFLEAVQARLTRQVDEFDTAIGPYAEYALNGNGKHLRPALVALSANALGKVNDAHVTVAVIIEMVHLATLVHDDIMDGSDLRRGKQTLHAMHGLSPGILAGDLLSALAFRTAACMDSPARPQILAELPEAVEQVIGHPRSEARAVPAERREPARPISSATNSASSTFSVSFIA